MSVSPSRRRVSLCTALLLAGGWSASAAAQECNPATHYAPITSELHSYTGDAEDTTEPRTQSIAHNCQQQYRVFLPPAGPRPPTGWPVLVCTGLGGYVAAGINRCIEKTTLQGKALEHGIAVIMAGMTLSTDTMKCEVGEETIPGHGLFHPPGFVPPGLDFAPYASPAYAMPEKDAVMLVQHVRHNGGRPGLLADIDPQRVAVLGQSAGANSFMWAALGPDRRHEEPFTTLGGQFDQPTRPDVAVLRAGFVWWPIFNPATRADPPHLVLHFGSKGDSKIPAARFGDCSPTELQQGSALWYEAVYPEPSLPLLMSYAEPSYCADYSSNGPTADYEYSFTDGGLEGRPKVREDACDDGVPPNEEPGGMHPCWSGFAWKAQHPASCRLFILSAETFACFAQGTEAETPGARNIDDLIVEWLGARFAELPTPWAVFEQAVVSGTKRMIGVPGTTATPNLIAAPDLIGTGNRITLTGARPDSPGRLYSGESANPTAFHAGVMLPVSGADSPLSFTTDAQGGWSMPVDALLAERGGQVWFQVWVDDDGAAQGVAASNALRAMIP